MNTAMTDLLQRPVQVFGQMVSQDENIESGPIEICALELVTFAPNSLHWVAPSIFSIFDNGDMKITVTHFANMRRTGGILDEGRRFFAYVYLKFLQEETDTKPLYEFSLPVIGLNYKQEVDNYHREWSFPSLIQVFEKSNYVACSQQWAPGNIEPPPPIIVLPPITFP